MFDLYPSTAIRVSMNPDPRLFGAECFSTVDVEHIGDLCTEMLNCLQGMNDYKYNIRFFPGNKVSLFVGGIFTVDPGPGPNPEVDRLYDVFIDVVHQFNWYDPTDPTRKRFHLCTVVLNGVDASWDMPDVGKVTSVQSFWCDCYRFNRPCMSAR